jgi:carbonic anhydrase/acetyltransferase-like protein (isoleucine patch superfamily)
VEIGTNSIIAAGAVVLEGTKVESGSIYGGIPARKIKDVPADLISGQIERIANHYLTYSGWFKDANDVPKP